MLGEARLEPGQPLGRGVGPDQLVVVEHGHAVEVLDRDDRVGEVAVGPRLGGAVVGLGGERVDVVAGPALDGGDQVGADALRHEAGRERGRRVGRPGAAVGAHRHPAHRLDAAGEDQVLEAAADPGRGLVDGLETGGAEAVELDAGHGLRAARPRARRSWRCRRPGRRSARPRRARRRRCGWCRGSGLRSRSSSIRPTTRSTGFTSCSEPAALPLPRGVRRWSYTNASCPDRCHAPIVTPLVSRSTGTAWCGLTHRADTETEEVAVDDDRLLTLDELCERVGMSVRNVRFYTSRGPGAAADPQGPLRLLLPRPRRPARAGPGAAEPRLHALRDREVRRRHPGRRDARGPRAGPHHAGAVGRRAADRDVARRAVAPAPAASSPTTTCARWPRSAWSSRSSAASTRSPSPSSPSASACSTSASRSRRRSPPPTSTRGTAARSPRSSTTCSAPWSGRSTATRAPRPRPCARSWRRSSRSRSPRWCRRTKPGWTRPSARASPARSR